MASAVRDCRPSSGTGAASELRVMARIPGNGTLDSGRDTNLRTATTPTDAAPTRTADTRQALLWRAGAVGESPCQGRARGADHAPLGDQTSHQPRRRHVKAVVRHRRAIGHDAHGFDAAG